MKTNSSKRASRAVAQSSVSSSLDANRDPVQILKAVTNILSSANAGKPLDGRSADRAMRVIEILEGKVPNSTKKFSAEFLANVAVKVKRPVGRPRKDATVQELERQKKSFDRMFRKANPIMSGLTVENSVSDDAITVLIDGKKMKMIKRYLETKYGISFEDYKRIYNLPDDYPSCAPAYRSVRAGYAVTQGLGTERVPRKGLKLATVNP